MTSNQRAESAAGTDHCVVIAGHAHELAGGDGRTTAGSAGQEHADRSGRVAITQRAVIWAPGGQNGALHVSAGVAPTRLPPNRLGVCSEIFMVRKTSGGLS
jgi:hypothetical protein